MIAGAPIEAHWHRQEPRRTLPALLLERIAREAFPRRRVLEARSFPDGYRNANFKLHLEGSSEPLALRIYEHHPSLCQKEVDLLCLIAGSVPVPEIIHVAPQGLEEIPPFVLMRCVEGINFRELKRRGDSRAIAQAAYSAGQTLASIHKFTFLKPGWLGPGARVTVPLIGGDQALPRLVAGCLDSPNLQSRMNADVRAALDSLIRSCRCELQPLDAVPRLVHGDFGKRNLLVHCVAENWKVAAVLDWEFAASASPLTDIGHFLRYERASRPQFEPHFSSGYRDAGGGLPEDWPRKARLVDLAACCESLTHDQLPASATAELLELIAATVENRDAN
jgi:aminoglycoside phosphotransferase (APT) family kinase protein